MLKLFKKREIAEVSLEVQPDEWFHKVFDSLEYTPDYHHLCKKEGWLLFVYCEMKENHPKSELIREHSILTDKPLPVGFTVEKYSLWKRELGFDTEVVALCSPHMKSQMIEKVKDFSTVYQLNDLIVPRTIVKGELHLIKPEGFKELDKYKENRVKFLRKRVKILTPVVYPFWNKDRDVMRERYQLHDNHTLRMVGVNKAWMYVGIPEYFDKQVEKKLFVPVNRFNHKGGKGLGVTDYYSTTGLDFVKGVRDPEKEKMVSIAMERRSKDGFQLEWSKDNNKQNDQPREMSRMRKVWTRLIGR